MNEDLERIDSAVEMLGELISVESGLLHAPELSSSASLELRSYLGQLTKLSRDLHGVALRMRRMPVRGLFQRMARLVRDLVGDDRKARALRAAFYRVAARPGGDSFDAGRRNHRQARPAADPGHHRRHAARVWLGAIHRSERFDRRIPRGDLLAGAAILSDGRLSRILDIERLVALFGSRGDYPDAAE